MIKPIGGMILITKKNEEDKTTKSGLVIAAAFNDYGPKSGNIVSMGDGEANYKGEIIPIPELKVGDTVYFPDHSGTDIEDEEGNKYILINHKHIMAKLDLN